MDEELTREEKARVAKREYTREYMRRYMREYMRQYRKTDTGKAAIKKANDRYWEKKFDELAEEFRALKDNSKV